MYLGFPLNFLIGWWSNSFSRILLQDVGNILTRITYNDLPRIKAVEWVLTSSRLCGAWNLNPDYRMLSWRSNTLLRATTTLCMVNCFLLRRITSFRLLRVRINSASINHLQGPWMGGVPAHRQTRPSQDAKPWPAWNSPRPRDIRIMRPFTNDHIHHTQQVLYG